MYYISLRSAGTSGCSSGAASRAQQASASRRIGAARARFHKSYIEV